MNKPKKLTANVISVGSNPVCLFVEVSSTKFLEGLGRVLKSYFNFGS